MKNTATHQGGFTLVEIMIVVAIIGMLASVAIPNYQKARWKAHQVACIQNLHQIDGAIQQWAMEGKKDAGEAVQYSDISAYLRNAVVCPAGGSRFADSYQVISVETLPVCLRAPTGQYPHKLEM
jgi:prepilin-type N-terminal cleavage/methylation domain-containing protein